MEDIYVIKIVFGILLSLGSIVLLFLAYRLYYKYLIQEKRCLENTSGTIIRYSYIARGTKSAKVFLPVVEYVVNNKKYKVLGPEYNMYKSIRKTGLLNNESEIEELDNGSLLIRKNTNSFLGININPISKIYPIDSKIDVYYDCNNPKLAYVKRYCNKKWYFYLMFICGIIILSFDLFVLFIL